MILVEEADTLVVLMLLKIMKNVTHFIKKLLPFFLLIFSFFLQVYDLSDEDRTNKLSRQTSDEAAQQNPPSFKSLLKQQKQQSKGINDMLSQPVATSRSYQGTTPYQQQMQLPKQQSQVVYDKRSESTHVERNLKDNTTDV
jgi:hypothetical protein